MQTDKTSKLGVIAFGKIKQFEKKIKELEEFYNGKFWKLEERITALEEAIEASSEPV